MTEQGTAALWGLRRLIEQPENFTQAAGSKWGRDAWTLNGVQFFVEDEGASVGIFSDTVEVRERYLEHEGMQYTFSKGTEQDLIDIFHSLQSPIVESMQPQDTTAAGHYAKKALATHNAAKQLEYGDLLTTCRSLSDRVQTELTEKSTVTADYTADSEIELLKDVADQLRQVLAKLYTGVR